MGSPQSAYPVVHVTGTNGKGSVSRMVTSLLSAVGLRTGTYTSPHLERINERLQVAGEPIGDEELAAELAALAELERFVGVEPTWFELVTAAAYRWFADEAVEAAVVEVGLGGRWDATNVAQASVAVVTNVELDHTELLGGTRQLIAAEKAGIVKAGSLLVLGETEPSVAAIFEAEAAEVGAAAIWRRGADFSAEEVRLAVGGRVADLATPAATYEEVFLPLHGAHQADNAAVALAGAQAFLGEVLPDDVVREAFAGLTVPGRLEVVRRRPVVVLDGAHNVAGAESLAEALEEDFSGAAHLLVVFGCLRQRDPRELLSRLPAARVAAIVACTPPSPRALAGAEVAAAAGSLGLEAVDGGDVGDALALALDRAGPDDLVLVTGSLYAVGAAREALRATPVADLH